MQSKNENGFLLKVSEYKKYPPLKKLQVERKIPYAQPSVHKHTKKSRFMVSKSYITEICALLDA